MTTIETKSEISQAQPTSAEVKIHWADAGQGRPDLEQKFEAMRARNWITDRMVQQYQKHWHCSREVALERLLAKASI
ncbi:MAG TPA: hypothetical protein VHM90_04455 [Phycisphaerae bacterium]|nr:hypothetical protein [Phycisphaerae bacterium]